MSVRDVVSDRYRLLRASFVGASVVVLAVATVFCFRGVGSSDAQPLSVSVTDAACAPHWHVAESGHPVFEVSNLTDAPYQVALLGANQRSVYGRIEMLGPHTTRSLQVALPPGTYSWRCSTTSGFGNLSSVVTVGGPAVAATPFIPVSSDEITGPTLLYRQNITAALQVLGVDTDRLVAAIDTGRTSEARADWLVAHMQYERLGAAYGTFGDLDGAINGRPAGLPGGVHDPDFTGFLRLEYEMWHDAPAPAVLATAKQLATDVHKLIKAFPVLQTGPNDVALRTHEILENSLQFELTGQTDEGSHTNLATVRANVDGTETALTAISSLLRVSHPELLQTATDSLRGLALALDQYDRNGVWTPLSALTRSERERLDGEVSVVLERLDPIPDLLEIDPNGD